MSSGVAPAAAATRIVCARSAAEMPVVTPCAASIDTVKFVPCIERLTGVIGASIARWIFNLLKIDDHAVRGFALGLTSHGIGTARAFQVSEEMGAFSGLAMGLSGVLTALLLPLALKLLGVI